MEIFGIYGSGFGACRDLLDVSYPLCCKLIVAIKHILGLADQCAHASTFECVRLCSESKIYWFVCDVVVCDVVVC